MKTDASLSDVLTELARAHEWKLTPAIVLKAAQSKKSLLHSHFCWDDTEAAELWRLDQASRLIRRVKVTYEIAPERTVRVRAFYNVTPNAEEGEEASDEESPAAVYVPLNAAMGEYREQVLARATAELRMMRNKYAHLTQLADVWDAIDKVA